MAEAGVCLTLYRWKSPTLRLSALSEKWLLKDKPVGRHSDAGSSFTAEAMALGSISRRRG
jgi:hypothetical protein